MLEWKRHYDDTYDTSVTLLFIKVSHLKPMGDNGFGDSVTLVTLPSFLN